MAFRLKCYLELNNNLGKHDAIVEFTELSIRDFIISADKFGDFNAYLGTKSKDLNIKVDSIDRKIFRSRISQSYILSVYQTFELFLRQFKDEHIDLYDKSWKFDETNDNLLIKLIHKITTMKHAKDIIKEFRLELFDYYRGIRNKYAHEYIPDSKIDTAFSKIKRQQDEISTYYGKLNAPNEFDKMSFDDFILFTRLVKDIAEKLNEIVKPQNNEVFVNYYKRKDLFKEINQNIERKKNALKGHMREQFGIVDDSEEILNLYLSHSPNG